LLSFKDPRPKLLPSPGRREWRRLSLMPGVDVPRSSSPAGDAAAV